MPVWGVFSDFSFLIFVSTRLLTGYPEAFHSCTAPQGPGRGLEPPAPGAEGSPGTFIIQAWENLFSHVKKTPNQRKNRLKYKVQKCKEKSNPSSHSEIPPAMFIRLSLLATPRLFFREISLQAFFKPKARFEGSLYPPLHSGPDV